MLNTLITGTLIFSDGNITVHQHRDGFTISNNEQAIFTNEMPLLNKKDLVQLFKPKKFLQLIPAVRQNKNDVLTSFKNFFSWQTELEGLHTIGY